MLFKCLINKFKTKKMNIIKNQIILLNSRSCLKNEKKKDEKMLTIITI